MQSTPMHKQALNTSENKLFWYLMSQSQLLWIHCNLLTVSAHDGRPHRELMSLCVCKTPFTTRRSTTSVPTTAGLWGLGYFLHTACVTVSHGWLKIKENQIAEAVKVKVQVLLRQTCISKYLQVKY